MVQTLTGKRTSSTLNNISWRYNELKDFEHALEYSNYGLEKDPKDYYLLTNKENALFGLEKLFVINKIIKNRENFNFVIETF